MKKVKTYHMQPSRFPKQFMWTEDNGLDVFLDDLKSILQESGDNESVTIKIKYLSRQAFLSFLNSGENGAQLKQNQYATNIQVAEYI